MKYIMLIAVLAIFLTACATAVAPAAPKIGIDCGTLSGSGVIKIEFDDVEYIGRLVCGTKI